MRDLFVNIYGVSNTLINHRINFAEQFKFVNLRN